MVYIFYIMSSSIGGLILKSASRIGSKSQSVDDPSKTKNNLYVWDVLSTLIQISTYKRNELNIWNAVGTRGAI